MANGNTYLIAARQKEFYEIEKSEDGTKVTFRLAGTTVSGRQLKVRAAAGISYAYFSFRVTDFLDRPSAPASVQSCS